MKFSQYRRQLLVKVRRGARTCDDPCILWRVLDSIFIQARVRLSRSNEANMHGSSHVLASRFASTSSCRRHWLIFIVRSPMEDFLGKNLLSYHSPRQKGAQRVLKLITVKRKTMFFVPVQTKGWKVGLPDSNLVSLWILFQGPPWSRQGWVLFEGTCVFTGIQFTKHFIEFVFVEPPDF